MSADGHFGFATIKGLLALVQVSHDTPLSALGTVDLKVFRHEFINIFRFSEFRTLHPNDVTLIEYINDDSIRYEEDNDTVFLSRGAMDLLRKLPSAISSLLKRVGTTQVALAASKIVTLR